MEEQSLEELQQNLGEYKAQLQQARHFAAPPWYLFLESIG